MHRLLLLPFLFYSLAAGAQWKDTAALNALIKQAMDTAAAAPELSDRWLKQARDEARKKGWRKQETQAIMELGYNAHSQGKYGEAGRLYQEVALIQQKAKDTLGWLKAANNQGLALMYLGQYAQSLQLYFPLLKLAEAADEKVIAGKILNNIGLNYESLEDWANALRYAKLSVALKQQTGLTNGLARTYDNIGNLYQYIRKPDSALHYQRLALALHNAGADREATAITLGNLGNLFTEINRPDSAIFYFQAALAIPDALNEEQKALDYLGLANLYLRQGNAAQARSWGEKAGLLVETVNNITVRKELSLFRYRYYKHQGQYRQAFEALEVSNLIGDTLREEQDNLENQKLAIRYETDKQRLADSLLLQDKVDVANAARIRNENRFLLALVVALIAAGGVAFFFNRSKLLRRRSLIAEQAAVIARQKQTEYQLQALRSQMNPHFIFNCFNTIDSFILQNRQYEASHLVQQFGRLTRRILELTTRPLIRLDEELSTLELYLQVEQVRTPGLFSFQRDVPADVRSVLLPPLLLQPFVENALIHGIRPLAGKTDRALYISLKAEETIDLLRLTITDNGRGMAAAEEDKKQRNGFGHQSLSTQITNTRIAHLYPAATDSGEYIRYEPLNPDGSGTVVTLLIPLNPAHAQSTDYGR